MNRVLPVLAFLALVVGGLSWALLRGGDASAIGLGGTDAANGSEEPLGDGEKPALPTLPGATPETPGTSGTPSGTSPAAGDEKDPTPGAPPVATRAYLAGRILDANGLPVRGVELHASLHEPDARSPRFHTRIGPVRTDAEGRFRFGVRPASLPESPSPATQDVFDGPPLVDGLGVELQVGRFHVLETPGRRYAAGREDVEEVVVGRPTVRLQVLDSQTRRPMPAGTWACPGYGVVDDGGWARLFGTTGADRVRFVADGYATTAATIAFPHRGESTRAEPILLERGFAIRGRTTDPDRKILAKAFVVAERTGGPSSAFEQFTQTRGDGEGAWELRLPIGTYRVMVFVNGHAPWSAAVAVQDRDHGVTATMRKFGTEGPPAVLPFRWTDRQELRIPMAIEDLPAPEIVAWIQTIVGAPITLHGEARDALGEVRINATFNGLPVKSALQLLAMLGNLEFDEKTAEIRVPR